MKDYLIKELQGGLIVSCQAFDYEPMYSVDTMVRVAKAAELGGAAAIRTCWPENVGAIRRSVKLPIFGINKILPENYKKMDDVVITPTVEAAQAVYFAGADVIAVDCTERGRTGDEVRALIRGIKDKLDVLVMGEISTLEEGLKAESYGVDILATTVAGYTRYSRVMAEPDYQLVSDLADKTKLPVNAEGRYKTPLQVKRAFEHGAWTVTVGSAITRPQVITKYFVDNMK